MGALSTSSGAKLWEISVDGNVQGVAVTGSEVVAGGHFDNVCDPGTDCQNPIVRHKVLAANVSTGALDTGWHPSVNSSLGVFGVAATSGEGHDRRRLHQGGRGRPGPLRPVLVT